MMSHYTCDLLYFWGLIFSFLSRDLLLLLILLDFSGCDLWSGSLTILTAVIFFYLKLNLRMTRRPSCRPLAQAQGLLGHRPSHVRTDVLTQFLPVIIFKILNLKLLTIYLGLDFIINSPANLFLS